MDLPKDFNAILLMAFNAGVATGVGYPAVEAVPDAWRDIKYRAFRDHLAGDPWSMERWDVERVAGLLEKGTGHPQYPERIATSGIARDLNRGRATFPQNPGISGGGCYS
jgi:hypothetical protein